MKNLSLRASLRRNTKLFALSLAVFILTQTAFAQLSRLRADGTRIVNEAGQEVILKGVGLGGWLLQEGYMINPSLSGAGTQWSMKKRLYDGGQSDAQVETFYQSWRDNFITQEDINWIADQGFNCVRIPMHYELFLTDAQRAVRNAVARANVSNASYDNYVNSMTTWYNNNQLFTDPNNLEGFRTLDRLLSWCAARNLYVVVDLHAAPGGQGTDANIADIFRSNDLWNRAIFQNVTVRLWETIVRRYMNNNTVAFWDLINEPNNVAGGNTVIYNLKNRLVNAVRALGDTHLIMIEGNGWGNEYTNLTPDRFTNRSNLVYNAHRYWIPEGDDNIRDGNPNQINRLINLVEFRARWNVPVWVGETGENTDAWLRQNVDKLNANGIGWLHWTYKRTSSSANAALRRIPGPPYLSDGPSAMSSVLNNIRFANNFINTGPLAAVDPRRGTTPTCNTINVPGTLQAESYCSMAGIQTETTTDAGGGQNVGYIDAGDWMAYRINVPTAGNYTISYRVASLSGGGSLRFERLGGSLVFGTLSVTSTGGWQNWTTISHTVNLPAGVQDVAIAVVTGGYNINWFSVASATNTGNLALNRPTVVSSVENATYPGSNAVDASATTRWSSAFSDPQWIYVDLGASYNVNRVRIVWEAARASNYQIQISGDASSWTTMRTITGNTTLTNDNTGLAGTGRYVRIYGTARGTVYGYSIFTLEVFGTSAAREASLETATDESDPSGFTTTCYPVPLENKATIVVDLPKAGHTSVNVFNALGSKAVEVYNGNLSAGTHEFTFNSASLPSGYYFYKVMYNQNMKIKKIIKK